MNNVQQDLYSLIGVPPTAAQEDIEDACLRLAEKYRPDKNPNSPEAAQSFAAVEQAFEILGNPAKRAAYDSSRQRTASPQEPIRLKHSFVGYLGAAVGASIMLLAFYAKPTEPGGTAMLIGSVITALCLHVAIRAVPKDAQHGKSVEQAARSVNKAIRSATSSAVALVAGIYLFFFWGGLGSPSQPISRTFDISTSSPLLILEGCNRQSERLAKCRVRLKSGTIDGYRITAKAMRYENGSYVDLPPAIVNAGTVSSYSVSEISLIMPDGTDAVTLAVR